MATSVTVVDSGKTVTVQQRATQLLTKVGIGPQGPPGQSGSSQSVYFDIRDYGTVTSGAYIDTAIQAALTAAINAGGGIVWIPPGDYWMQTELSIPTNSAVNFEGAGHQLSILRWQVDLGAGKFGFRIPSGAGGGRYIRHLSIIGPGGFTLGAAPNQMSGIQWSTGVIVDQCFVRTWKYGLYQWDNHQSVLSSKIQNCLYGIYYPNGTPTTEDQFVHNTVITSNTLASVGVASGVPMFGEYIDVHFGFAPFGIYGESGTASIVQSVRFIRCPFEAIGNAAVYDEDAARAVVNSTFDECVTLNQASAGPYRLSTKRNDAWIDVGTIQGCVIEGTDTFGSPLVVSALKASVTINGLRWQEASNVVQNCNTASKPVISTPSPADNVLYWKARRGGIYKANGPISAGDLVQRSVNGTVNRYLPGGIVMGVAAHAAVYPQSVVIIEQGPCTMRAVTNSALAENVSLIPDPANTGQVRDGTGLTIGFATSVQGGGFVNGVLRLAPPDQGSTTYVGDTPVFIGTSAPSTTAPTYIWLDTSTSPPTMRYEDGT